MENILNRSIIAFGYSFVFLFCLFLSEVSFEILGLILSIIVSTYEILVILIFSLISLKYEETTL